MSDFSKDRQSASPLSGLKSDVKSFLSPIADALAEQEYQRGFLPLVTLTDCVQYFKDEAKALEGKAVTAGFVLSVKKNLDPRNENDQFLVVHGLVDAQRKPIVLNGETVSRVLHTKTIDDAWIRALNGKDTGIFML